MSAPSYEEVEARVQRDACPEPRRIIQRAVDRYRKHEPNLLYVTTISELTHQLRGVLTYFYLRQVYAPTSQEREKWIHEAQYLVGYIRQLEVFSK